MFGSLRGRAQSWIIVHIYEDHDSGGGPDRTEIRRMLPRSAAKSGGATAVETLLATAPNQGIQSAHVSSANHSS